jgi:TRAP-type mannitol/chloroaromatic compound transport system permease small subunit
MPIQILSKLLFALDTFSEWIGRISAWLILGMVLLISHNVIMRYVFNENSVALQELEWHLFAASFLLGAAYTLKHNQHVRVDLLYQSQWMSDRRRAWVDLFGHLFLFLPFCFLLIYTSQPFIENAYRYAERSPDPGGLPYRWIIKSFIAWGFMFLLLQSLAEILRNTLFLFNKDAQ